MRHRGGCGACDGGCGRREGPFPPPTAGTGTEPTAGSGTGAGVVFRPRYGIATYEPISGSYVIYLTDKPLPCTRTYLATPPYLTVSIVTAGSPLVVGKPSLQQPDKSFVQTDFYVSATHYYAVQPGVKLGAHPHRRKAESPARSPYRSLDAFRGKDVLVHRDIRRWLVRPNSLAAEQHLGQTAGPVCWSYIRDDHT